MTTQQRLVLIITILASSVAFLDGTVVNVALPAIAQDLGGGLSLQQWVVNAYLITLGACILLAGSLSDLFGRRRILVWGLIGFGVTSMLCAFAPSGVFLGIARALQGIAGALLVPSSLAMIIGAFKGAAQSKAIGQWTSWTSVAIIAGPLVGGFLVDAGSWRWVFAINLVPIACALWMTRSLDERHEQTERTASVDVIGAALCTTGLTLATFGLVQQPHYGWDSPAIWLSLSIGMISLGAFLWHERRTKFPMVPLSLFKIRNFTAGNLATTAIYAGLSLSSFVISIFLQQSAGFSATEAGLAMLPTSILMIVLSSRFGALAGTYGPRWFMTAGPLVAAGGFGLMLMAADPFNFWTQVLPGIVLFGLGLSMTVAPLTAAVLGDIDAKRAGIGSAINNAVARIAGLLATAAAGMIVGTTIGLQGFHQGVIAMAALLAVGGILSAVGIQNNRAVRRQAAES